MRRISSFISWNRIFGGWGTDKKTQNIEIQFGFVAFFGIRDLAQVGGAVENLYNTGVVSPREITNVAPENVNFVEKSRVVGAPDGGGPVGRLARGSPIGVSTENDVLMLSDAP